MAIAITHLANGVTAVGATSFTTPSVTPAANSMLVLSVRLTPPTASTSDTETVSGFGTWARVANKLYTTIARLVVIQTQVGASPSAGTVTFTASAANSSTFAILWSLDQVTGHDPTTPFPQAITGSGQFTGGANQFVGPTLAAGKSVDSRNFSVYTSLNPVTTFTPQAGWTELLSNYKGGTANESIEVVDTTALFTTDGRMTCSAATSYVIYAAMEIQVPPPLTSADTCHVTDSGQMTRLVSGAQTAHVTDNGALPTPPVGADTCHVADSGKVTRLITASQTGHVTDAGSIPTPPVGADLAHAADGGALPTPPTGTDTGSVLDSGRFTDLAVAGADSGHVLDSARIEPSAFSADEHAAGADSGRVSASWVAGADTAAAAGNGQITATGLGGWDTAHGTDAASVTGTTASDTGRARDQAQLTLFGYSTVEPIHVTDSGYYTNTTVAAGDTGALTDASAAPLTAIQGAETAAVVAAATSSVAIVESADAATVSETAQFSQGAPAGETGTVVDAGSLVKVFTAGETIHIAQDAWIVSSAVTGADTATGRDQAGLAELGPHLYSDTDLGRVAEHASAQTVGTSVNAADTGTVRDASSSYFAADTGAVVETAFLATAEVGHDTAAIVDDASMLGTSPTGNTAVAVNDTTTVVDQGWIASVLAGGDTLAVAEAASALDFLFDRDYLTGADTSQLDVLTSSGGVVLTNQEISVNVDRPQLEVQLGAASDGMTLDLAAPSIVVTLQPVGYPERV